MGQNTAIGRNLSAPIQSPSTWKLSLVERRVLAYLFVSALFMFVMMTMRPKQPENQPGANPDAAQVQADGEKDLDSNDTDQAAQAQAEAIASSDQINASEAADDDLPQRPERQVWYTLGSIDAKDTAKGNDDKDADPANKLLITLTNRGAGIERIEMIQRDADGRYRFRRVDTRSGYFGYVAPSLSADLEGCRVNVIGPGTPADLAGLQVGDVIVKINEADVVSSTNYERILSRTRPGDTISLSVLRGSEKQSITLTATLTEHPLDLVRLSQWAGPDGVKGNLSRLSCLLTLTQFNAAKLKINQAELPQLPSLYEGLWNVNEIDTDQHHGWEFRFPISASQAGKVAAGSGSLEVVRRFLLAKDGSGYDIDLETEVVNASDKEQEVAYRLEGPNGLTLEGWWYSTKISPNWWGGAGARDIVFNTVAEKHRLLGLPAIFKEAKKRIENNEPGQDLNQSFFEPSNDPSTTAMRYVGVDGQYFAAAYLPPADQQSTDAFVRGHSMLLCDVDVVNPHQVKAANVSFYMDSRSHKLAAGERLTDRVRLFAGPKQPTLLEQRGLGSLIEYGFFGFVSRSLSGFLHGLYAVVRNYGIAIILLTLVVRGCLFPLSRKAAQNAQKMQELAPEFKKIAEKYKDDMEKRLRAQQQLQKKHQFNPLSGCLPMFVQLPIFMGLYRCLSCDIELRQAAFIPGFDWCSNLAAPDMLFDWSTWMMEYFSGRGTGWFGPYFNILPLLVMALFLAQQKMFMPPPTDEQQEITQKVMFFMTFAMGVFFFKVAAGLCIYFITSSLWGMAERVLVKKSIQTSPPTGTVGTQGDGGPGGQPLSWKPAPAKLNRPKNPPKKSK